MGNDGERYPGSIVGNQAIRYGPLPDYGSASSSRVPAGSPVALIYHTTETTVVPGYNDGKSSPHYTYVPESRHWVWHSALDARVGTMRGGSPSRPYANDKAIQVEIVCYSDKGIADAHPDRLWVGDLGEEHYQDLADFAKWCAEGPHSIELVALEVPRGGWRYGTTSPYRQSEEEWYAFPGIGAHGSVPGQTHWDTGVLDLGRIAELARAGLPGSELPGEATMFPLNYGDESDDVQWLNQMLHACNYSGEGFDSASKLYSDETAAAVLVAFPNANPEGHRVSGRQGAILIQRLADIRIERALSRMNTPEAGTPKTG